MLGRNSYTREELDNARTALDRQLAAYRALADTPALSDFEPLFFNNMTLVLDRLFVHRIRSVSGKDGNPLNEVELLTESLMSNDGVLRTGNTVSDVSTGGTPGLRADELAYDPAGGLLLVVNNADRPVRSPSESE